MTGFVFCEWAVPCEDRDSLKSHSEEGEWILSSKKGLEQKTRDRS